MTLPVNAYQPDPCRLTTAYTSGWAWRIHQRLYLIPATLIDGVSEAVLEANGQRVRAELVLFLPDQGIGMVWCREDLPVSIVPIGEGGGELISFCTGYGPDIQWIGSLAERLGSMPYWGVDASGRLVTFQPEGRGLEKGIPLAEWLTPELLAAWDHGQMVDIWQCVPCGVLRASAVRTDQCGSCGGVMSLARQERSHGHTPTLTMERVIHKMGYDPVLTRNGPRAWLIRKGSAEMHLRYAEDEASLCADVGLVRIGEETRKEELYRYLLQENAKLDAFGFSIQNDRVTISLLISSRSIRENETAALFLDLLKKSDDYDNHLVSVFDAKWL